MTGVQFILFPYSLTSHTHMPYAVHITYNFFYFSDGGRGIPPCLPWLRHNRTSNRFTTLKAGRVFNDIEQARQ